MKSGLWWVVKPNQGQLANITLLIIIYQKILLPIVQAIKTNEVKQRMMRRSTGRLRMDTILSSGYTRARRWPDLDKTHPFDCKLKRMRNSCRSEPPLPFSRSQTFLLHESHCQFTIDLQILHFNERRLSKYSDL